MSGFRSEIQQYQQGLEGLARQELGQREEQLQGRRGLLQAKEISDVTQAGQAFSQKLGAEAQKFVAGEGIAGGTGVIAPMTLKALSKGAKYASGRLDSLWKVRQAQRFRKLNNISEDDDLPDETPSDDIPMRTFRPATESAPAEESSELPDAGEALQARRAGLLGRFRNLPRGSQRSIRQQMGQEDIERPQNPEQLKSNLDSVEPKIEAEEQKLSGTAEQEASGAEGSLENEAKTAQQSATSQEDELEGEAEDAVEDLAPEISSASSALGTVGGILGDMIPFVGAGLGIYALVEAGEHASDAEKALNDDPYASVRGKIQSAEQKMKSLSNTISADQFSTKIGAGAVPVGSLAIPAPDTARQMMPGGSHF
jgi:hypothetical protein